LELINELYYDARPNKSQHFMCLNSIYIHLIKSCRRLQKMNWMCLNTPGACFWGHSEPEMSCGRRPDCWRFRSCGLFQIRED